MELKMCLLLCCTCGIPFAVSDDFDERLRKCHNEFFCPAGHAQSYTGKSEEEKLRDILKTKEEELKSLRALQLKLIDGARRTKRKTGK